MQVMRNRVDAKECPVRTWSMLKPGVDMRSRSNAAESSALSRLTPDTDVEVE